MNSEDKEAVFIDAAKADLNRTLQSLDPAISTRLGMARHQALDAALNGETEKHRVSWLLPATGMAAAFVGILAFFLLLQSPGQKEFTSESVLLSASESMDDLELLASSESIEFYENLEFYAWLSEQNRAG